MPKSTKRASSSDSYDDGEESEVSVDEDYIEQFAGLTLPELRSGRRADPEDEMKLQVLQHALEYGYSANVTPSLDTFMDLVSTVRVPDCEGIRRKDQLQSIKIIAQLVKSTVSPTAFPTMLIERPSTSPDDHGKLTLFISDVFLPAVKKAPSFAALKSPATKSKLLDAHAQNDHKFKEVQLDDGSENWGWTKLIRTAMSEYVLSDPVGPKTAASSSSTPGRQSSSSSRRRRRRRSPLRSSDAVYGPAKPITEADRNALHLKFYDYWREFVEELRRQYPGVCDLPSSPSYAALPRNVKWTLHFNKGSMERKMDVDYEEWYGKAKEKGMLVEEEDK